MHNHFRNINDAFHQTVDSLMKWGVNQPSRNGDVTTLQEPVITSFRLPNERVLFSRFRKANPFFHIAEAFWMLGGRNDAAFLDQFVGDFGSRFAEENGRLHGAYGYRWRNHFGYDQLDIAVDMLRADPRSRRVVISMWDVDADLEEDKRDLPCNVAIFPRLIPLFNGYHVLDLTVTCRSNDAIWGLFGANAVHFSVLQEYLAWRLGSTGVGSLHILSNNLHIYDWSHHLFEVSEQSRDLYATDAVATHPLFYPHETEEMLREDLTLWLEDPTNRNRNIFSCHVFRDLLIPMCQVHQEYKQSGATTGACLLPLIKHSDWREAAQLWLSQRKKR